MFSFEKLIAYQKSINVIEQMYLLTKTWPKSETFGLTDQLHRSVTSIGLNIAEGSSRTKKDFRHFLDIARGSCFESIAILSVAKRLGYITSQQYSALYLVIDELTKIIQGLKRSLIIHE